MARVVTWPGTTVAVQASEAGVRRGPRGGWGGSGRGGESEEAGADASSLLECTLASATPRSTPPYDRAATQAHGPLNEPSSGGKRT